MPPVLRQLEPMSILLHVYFEINYQLSILNHWDWARSPLQTMRFEITNMPRLISSK